MFANHQGDWGSMPGWVIPNTEKKMVLDDPLLNTQFYKVQIKSKWNNFFFNWPFTDDFSNQQHSCKPWNRDDWQLLVEEITWFCSWERFLCTAMCQVFVAASHQTRLDTRSKARRPIKVGIKGRGRSGTSRDSNPACLCCSSAHLVQCEPDEASSFTNPNVGPGTYASLRLKLDAWSSAVQGGQRRQKCSSPTRR